MGYLSQNRDERTGQGCYLAEMSIFSPEHVRLVEQALIEGPGARALRLGPADWSRMKHYVIERDGESPGQ